ncbi:MAG: hypothetical protein KDA92_18040, partial [Planctomycetales bacterium]|nr:hypothetical protein [Planctomycetales bacterium]
LAIALSVLAAPKTEAQQPGGYANGYYPTQQAIYMTTPGSIGGEAPAGFAMSAPSGVQLASCSSCDAMGCDSPGCGLGGGAFGGGCSACGGACGGACGMGGLGSAIGGVGECLAGGYDGYNSQCFGQANGPYGSGANCLPRWFDASAEWLFWQRDISESQAFASTNIAGLTALDANQLDLSHVSGFRVTGAYLIGPSTGLEATYFGGFNWATGIQATGNGNLYSVFSNFGTDPFNGYAESDAANLQQVSLSSELDNGELNLRRRWVSANCLVHSSVLVGVRYLRLRDDLQYRTVTATDSMTYGVKTDNDLVGAQIGGDMYIGITPRFKIGGDIKAGVYGSNSSQRTWMNGTQSPWLNESANKSDTSFVGEAGLSAIFRISSQWTLRAGYQVLFVDNVALGVDNFNTQSPFGNVTRDVFLNNSGDVFYHGSSLGFEWTW